MSRMQKQNETIARIEGAVAALSNEKFDEYVQADDGLGWVWSNILEPNGLHRSWDITAENRMVDRGNAMAETLKCQEEAARVDSEIKRLKPILNDRRALLLQIQDQNSSDLY